MAFAAGKAAKILVNEFDLSTYFNAVDLAVSHAPLETTTFGKNSKTRILDPQRDGSLSLKGNFDGAAGAVDEVLSAVLDDGTSPVVTAGPVGLAVGDPVRLLKAIESNFSTATPNAGLVTTAAELTPSEDNGLEFGFSLKTLAAEVASTDGASLDNAAATTNGGVGHFHCTASAGDGTQTDDEKIQHSVDNAVWADLISFTQVTISPTSERVEVAAGTTVRRYLRRQSTIAAGGGAVSFTSAVAFARR